MSQKRTKTTKKQAGRSDNRPAKPAKRGRKKKVVAEEGQMSLRRFLAASGLDSRRNIDEYLHDGRISVDGDVVSEPSTLVNPAKQRICVDGERAKLEPKKYFLLNKPKGFLCTNRDPKGRRRAVDLVVAPGVRLFTVGRLDENSEGLLLVTNDGELANKMAHPRYQVRRKYRVQVAGVPKQETLRELKDGLYFKDGRFRLHGAKRLKTQGKSSFLEIEMREGQNREIRRLMARVGHKVMQLQRVEFGPLKLGRIASGKFRELKLPEIKILKAFVEEMEEVRRKTPTPRRRPERKATRRSTSKPQSAHEKETGVEKSAAGKSGVKPSAKPPAKTKAKSGKKTGAEKIAARAVKSKAAKARAKAKKAARPKNAKPEGFVAPKSKRNAGKKK
jgi:23S rRNA pseudouridine2605 synthase